MNRTIIALFCLLLGLGGGAAGMYFAGGSSTEKPSRANSGRAANADTSGESAGEGHKELAAADGSDAGAKRGAANGTARADAAESPDTPVSTTAESPDGLLARAIDAVPDDPIPTGDGSITGTVKSTEGKPLSGALIRAYIASEDRPRSEGGRGKTSAGPAALTPLTDSVRDYIKTTRRNRVAIFEARSRADGTYSVSGLSREKKFSLSAWLEGWQVRAADPRAGSRNECGAVYDFTATQLTEVTFEVLMPDGSKAAKAFISCTGGEAESKSFGWRPDATNLELKPGTWSAIATIYDPSITDTSVVMPKSAKVSFEAVAGSIAGPIVLQTKQPAGIGGTYTLLPGKSSRGSNTASVFAIKVDGDVLPALAKFMASRTRSDSYNTPGKFQFTGLAPGRYALALVDFDRIAASVFVDVVADAITKTELVAAEPDPATVLLVRVIGPDSQAVENCSISISNNSGDYEYDYEDYYGRGGVWQRPDGSYWVPLAGLANNPDKRAKAQLSVSAKAFGARKVPLPAAPTNDMTVEFKAPAWLAVTLEGADAMEEKDVLKLWATNDASKVRTDARSGEGSGDRDYMMEGRYYPSMVPGSGGGSTPPAGLTPSPTLKVVGPLEPGQFTVSLGVAPSDNSGYWNTITIGTSPATISSGVNRISMTVPALHKLIVAAPDLDPGTQLALSVERVAGRTEATGYGGAQYSPTDSNRKAEYKCLPAGTYIVSQSSGKGGQMRITIPGPAEVTFTPQARNAQKLWVGDKACASCVAGLQRGDIIIALDGVEFVDEKAADRAMKDAGAKEGAVSFTIIRDGQRTSVTLQGSVFGEDVKNSKLGYSPTPRP